MRKYRLSRLGGRGLFEAGRMALRCVFLPEIRVTLAVTLPPLLSTEDDPGAAVCHVNPTIKIKILKVYSVE